METLWFGLICFMFSAYVILDGFDFGAAMISPFVAKTDDERRLIYAAIGPVWDGNQVWLIAGGGTLVFAFPKVYAVAFSGFYLPLMIVLWLIVLRGLAIEFRGLEDNHLWRAFWDGTFFFSSALLALVLGVALGNVVRGVPLGSSGSFRGPLFTNFLPGRDAGILDWYTVLVGAFAAAALALHGALYLAWKTAGPVNRRSLEASRALFWGVLGLGSGTTLATLRVCPDVWQRITHRPAAWCLAAVAAGALVWSARGVRRGRELAAFLGSGSFLAAMLAATAVVLYPTMLRSTIDRSFDLEVSGAATGGLGLAIGLAWWIPAVLLAIGYVVYLFWAFRGKV